MIDLDDIRQDIFDIKTVPKVLYVYRGDTFELDLSLTISSTELNSVVLNCDGLPEATRLTLLETTDVSSKWHLVLNKSQTLILAPKTHDFTITIVRTDGTELTLYKGIMAVNNRVHSNYSNNYYIATLLKQTVPTISDNDYLIGTMWVNVLTDRVYFLTSVVNDEANWLDYSDQLDKLNIRIDDVLDGTTIVKKAEQDANGNVITSTYETKIDATSKKSEIDGRLDTAESEITKIKDGTTIVKKAEQAEQDDSGNVITSTYETKADVTSKLLTKVDKTQKIIGIDLQDNILLDEFKTALGNATQIFAGLMSPEDKAHLDGLMELFDDDGDNVVNTIAEVLAIFNNYPEGADLVSALAGKVDKVEGKQLSTNDLTNALKNYYDIAYAHSQNTNSNPHKTTYAQLLNKPTTIEQAGILNVYNKAYIDALKDLNGWQSTLLTPTPLVNAQSILKSVISAYDKLTFVCRNTATGELDTDEVVGALMVTGNKLVFFDDNSINFTVGVSDGVFSATGGYELIIYGFEVSQQVAENIEYDNTTSSLDSDNLQEAVDEIAQDVKTLEATSAEQKMAIDMLEEATRKANSGDVQNSVSGVDVISLGKDTANAPLQVELKGGTVISEQLVKNWNFVDTSNWLPTIRFTVSNNTMTFKPTTIYSSVTQSAVAPIIGNKYYITVKLKLTTATGLIRVGYGNPGYILPSITVTPNLNTDWQTLSKVSVMPSYTYNDTMFFIVDLRDSGWDDILIKDFIVYNITKMQALKVSSPMHNTTFDLLTDEQIKNQIDVWVANGTLPNDEMLAVSGNKRIKSVGKNLFDESKWQTRGVESGKDVLNFTAYYQPNDGIKFGNPLVLLTGNQMKKGATYTVIGKFKATTYFNMLSVIYTDLTVSTAGFFATNYTSSSRTVVLDPLKTPMYLYIDTGAPDAYGYAEVGSIQINEGSTALPYEPYVSSELYLNAPRLYSLPNGVKDTIEYRNGKYYYTQRVKEYTLQESDVTEIVLSGTNTVVVRTKDFTDFIGGLNEKSNRVLLDGYFELNNGTVFVLDSLSTVGGFYDGASTTFLRIGFPAGTTLAPARTALAGTKILYQIVTPITTEIPASGLLLGFGNGTTYIESVAPPAVDVVNATGIARITFSDAPIKSIEEVYKLTNGEKVKLEVSNAVITPDKLGFTHPQVSQGDVVYFTYYYAGDYVLGNTTVTYYKDGKVAVDSTTGKVYKIKISVNDGVWTIGGDEI